ncbi:MAG: hypothetical protein ACKOWF_15015 [Chloroflexota bacterium]
MERGTIGMTLVELESYLQELLLDEAAEAAERNGSTVEEELASTGFMAARAASSYAIHLINANNAFIARYLIDQGLIGGAARHDESGG